MSHSADQKRSSFAKHALFFGFGDSSAASLPQAASPTAPRSLRSFPADGAVGLGIVAALSAGAAKQPVVALTRTETVASAAAALKRCIPPVDEMELSESYTCMTSYLGRQPVKKGIYYGDGNDGIVVEFRGDEVVFLKLPPVELVVPPFQVADFLRCCFRCKKELDGLDIYMYSSSIHGGRCRPTGLLLED